jgi:hypothetical protein
MSVQQPVVPEPLIDLGMHGNREIFQRRLDEGYTKYAFGSGDWVSDERIVRLFVFFKADRIATYQHPKKHDGVTNVHGEPFEAEYTAEEFEVYKDAWSITVGQEKDLSGLLAVWAK